ncbi:MAG: hypothetical protein ING77_10325, partial [Rhodocyclaceae bacterium]|nr:hypothetical protein [Rhodocyclaceae bacterium]
MATHIQAGTCIKDSTGRRLRTDVLVGTGAQGDVYATSESGLMLKVFRDSEAMIRTNAFMALRLPQGLPLCAPERVVQGLPGYLMRRAGGEALTTWLLRDDLSFGFGVRAARALMDAIARLHACGLAHGDVRPENIFIEATPMDGDWAVDGVTLIDVDNYAHPNCPPPNLLGDLLTMAPELRRLHDARLVSTASDVYSAAQVIHQLLLRREDSADAATLAEFHEMQLRGGWINDPLRNAPSGSGLDARILDSRIAALMRASLDADPANRPEAWEWQARLDETLAQGRIIACHACRWPFFVEHGTKSCPHSPCRKPLLVPVLELPGGGRHPLNAPLLVGADLVKGLPRRHALFRRMGPLV